MYSVCHSSSKLVRARQFTFDMSNKQVPSECSSKSSPVFEQAVANAMSSSLREITSKVTSIIDNLFESFKRRYLGDRRRSVNPLKSRQISVQQERKQAAVRARRSSFRQT